MRGPPRETVRVSIWGNSPDALMGAAAPTIVGLLRSGANSVDRALTLNTRPAVGSQSPWRRPRRGGCSNLVKEYVARLCTGGK